MLNNSVMMMIITIFTQQQKNVCMFAKLLFTMVPCYMRESTCIMHVLLKLCLPVAIILSLYCLNRIASKSVFFYGNVLYAGLKCHTTFGAVAATITLVWESDIMLKRVKWGTTTQPPYISFA